MKLTKLFTLLILITSMFSVSAQYIQCSNFEYYAYSSNEYLYVPEIGTHTTITLKYTPYSGDIPFEEYITHYNNIKGGLTNKLQISIDNTNNKITITNPTDKIIRDVSVQIPYETIPDFQKDYQVPTYQAPQIIHTSTYNQIFTDYPQIIPILLVAMQMAVWLGGGSYIRSVVVLLLGAGVVSILLPGLLPVVFVKTPEIVAIIIAIQFIGLYQEFMQKR